MNIVEKLIQSKRSTAEDSSEVRKAIKNKRADMGSPEQACILQALLGGPLKAKELAEKSGILGPSISRATKKLVENNLITRKVITAREGGDAREVIFTITAKGRRHIIKVTK